MRETGLPLEVVTPEAVEQSSDLVAGLPPKALEVLAIGENEEEVSKLVEKYFTQDERKSIYDGGSVWRMVEDRLYDRGVTQDIVNAAIKERFIAEEKSEAKERAIQKLVRKWNDESEEKWNKDEKIIRSGADSVLDVLTKTSLAIEKGRGGKGRIRWKKDFSKGFRSYDAALNRCEAGHGYVSLEAEMEMAGTKLDVEVYPTRADIIQGGPYEGYNFSCFTLGASDQKQHEEIYVVKVRVVDSDKNVDEEGNLILPWISCIRRELRHVKGVDLPKIIETEMDKVVLDFNQEIDRRITNKKSERKDADQTEGAGVKRGDAEAQKRWEIFVEDFYKLTEILDPMTKKESGRGTTGHLASLYRRVVKELKEARAQQLAAAKVLEEGREYSDGRVTFSTQIDGERAREIFSDWETQAEVVQQDEEKERYLKIFYGLLKGTDIEQRMSILKQEIRNGIRLFLNDITGLSQSLSAADCGNFVRAGIIDRGDRVAEALANALCALQNADPELKKLEDSEEEQHQQELATYDREVERLKNLVQEIERRSLES
jgi:hypothetical protein